MRGPPACSSKMLSISSPPWTVMARYAMKALPSRISSGIARKNSSPRAPLASFIQMTCQMFYRRSHLFSRTREPPSQQGDINAPLDLDTVLQRVAGAAKELYGSDGALIALHDPAAAEMIVRYRIGEHYREHIDSHAVARTTPSINS